MSWQQVNLYLPELKPKEELLSFKATLGICAAVCVFFVAYGVLGSIKNSELRQSTQLIQQQLVKQAQEIATIRLAMPRSQAALVQQEADQLRLALERRQRIYQLINQQNLGNSDGFSKQLIALARQHVKDISVQEFEFSSGGSQFNFSGKATVAQAVPQYLQRLQTESSFENTVFGHLALEQSRSGGISFSLSQETQVSKAGR